MSLFDKIKDAVSPKKPTPNKYLEALDRKLKTMVPVILEDGSVVEVSILSVMDNDHCVAVNHKYSHDYLDCPCLLWELENDNEYGQRKQFTMEEAKRLHINGCQKCLERSLEEDKEEDDE